jgi:hypothetical protein
MAGRKEVSIFLSIKTFIYKIFIYKTFFINLELPCQEKFGGEFGGNLEEGFSEIKRKWKKLLMLVVC